MKYYLLTSPIEQTTEKAFAVATGSNNCISRANLKVYLDWIPYSQIKEVENKIYIPAWLIMSNSGLKNAVNFSDSIEIEEPTKVSKPRKTKEQKEQEIYNTQFVNRFNDSIPNEYIEYWFDNDTSINGIRFTTIDKLKNRLAHDDIVKLNIIRNGIKEVIK
jgi:hypothetical protein